MRGEARSLSAALRGTVRDLGPILKESTFLTAKTTAMVCWLFVGSGIFSAAFALLGGQEVIEKWVLSLNMTPVQFMMLAQVIIFLLGWPLEWTEIIVIFMPIFIPLLPHFNIDPLFFGLLVALNLQTAFLSPPVAMAAFYLKGVSPPHVTLNQIFVGHDAVHGDPGDRGGAALRVPRHRPVAAATCCTSKTHGAASVIIAGEGSRDALPCLFSGRFIWTAATSGCRSRSNASARVGRWSAFSLGCAAFFLSFFHRVCTGALAGDLQREFEIGAAALGTLGATYFYIYGAEQVPLGVLDRHAGPAPHACRRHDVAGIGSIAYGLADSFARRAGRAHADRARRVGRVRLHAQAECQLVFGAALRHRRRRPQRVGHLGALAATAPLAWLVTQMSVAACFHRASA